MNSAITVPFLNTQLFVVDYNGEPHTPIKPIVEGMGMDWAAQYIKIQNRFKSCTVKIAMQLPGDNQTRKVTCMALRKLAAWLNTISPNKVRPEIRQRVIQYQERCDDVLYEYWMKKHQQPAELHNERYSGRLVLNIENGQLRSARTLKPGDFAGSLELALELASKAGYFVVHEDDFRELKAAGRASFPTLETEK